MCGEISFVIFSLQSVIVATLALARDQGKGLQGCGLRGKLWVTQTRSWKYEGVWGNEPSHPQGSSTSELEYRWTPKSSKSDCRGQTSMAWGVPYTIVNLLELKMGSHHPFRHLKHKLW
jgi:hypothetical protein